MPLEIEKDWKLFLNFLNILDNINLTDIYLLMKITLFQYNCTGTVMHLKLLIQL